MRNDRISVLDEIVDATIHSTIINQADERPNSVAISSFADQLTFIELVAASEKFAQVLIERGIGKSDRVAVWVPNSTTWAVVQNAISLVGAECVLVSTRATVTEAKYIVEHSEAVAIIAVESFLQRRYAHEAATILADLGRSNGAVIGVGMTTSQLPAPKGQHSLSGAAPDQAAAWLYTSGTTGTPKATAITQRVWVNNARLTASRVGITGDDRIYSACPMFFAFGSMTAMMGAFTTGASFYTSPTFNVGEATTGLERCRASWFIGVPTMWIDLVATVQRGQLRDLRGGISGGAPIPAAVIEQLLDPAGWALNMTTLYGMTEAPGISVIADSDPFEKRITTVGRPGPHIEVRIVDESGADVQTGTVGQIVTRGYHTTSGYLRNAEATRQLFRDGWLQTGDLGEMDEDGYLCIRGRITDMMLVGGSNVYAKEVEDVIQRIRGVTRVAVVGKPHERLGEIPIAWIQPSDGVTLDRAEITAQCRSSLAAHKVPREIYFTADMPLTGSGKIRKSELGLASTEHIGTGKI